VSRPYVATDLTDVQRIWRECGWVESDEEAAHIGPFLEEAIARVGEVDGTVESLTSSHRGVMRYRSTDIDAALVTSVTTSWVGRKRGLARRLTADVLADAAARGALVAALGIFEHGFYDMLGFGSGPYEHTVRFDPSSLTVPDGHRTPVRIGLDDHVEVAEALRRRRRGHGGVSMDGSHVMKAELGFLSPPLGLGYRDESGRLTHFVYGKAKGEEGPYRLHFVSYETTGQLLELLSLLRSLGDQVRLVVMAEPPDVQMQDIVRHPFRAQVTTKGSAFESGIRSNAWWQVRILDLLRCVSVVGWAGEPVRCNLVITDPLEDLLAGSWRGVGGHYVAEFGASSHARPGHDDALPILAAGVGAFSRLWMGIRPATSLAVTDDLAGPDDLLSALDEVFLSPTPRPGIYF
jgi:hypothetical protein